MSRFGVAYVEGAQQHVIATPKHYAVNSIEDTRFDVDVTIDERSLRELYLPHFRATVDAGTGAIMSAYNSVNGAFAAENRTLLTTILKEDWGYEGFVMSDWIWGTHDTVGAATAGLDIEMPGPIFYGEPLIAAVEEGAVPEAAIDEAARRILRAKLRFGLDDPPAADPSVVESAAHVALTLEVALASMVLLKNEAALPLDDAGTVAVLGPLADIANLGDAGSSTATPSTAVDPLTGIEAAAAAHGATVVHTDDPALAATADAAVVVVGLTADDEGEQIPLFPGGDRDDLGLHAQDVALIEAVVAAQPRTIVVLEGGSAIRVDPWVDSVPGLVMAWYPGMEGGTALGQLLFGDANFAGRLPLSIPVDDADLVPFDHVSTAVTYDYWHGYRHLDREGTEPRFPFGFGLSYTSFALEDLTVAEPVVGDGDTIALAVAVRNTGDRAGDHVVQAYASAPDSAVERAPRDLRAFTKVSVEPGETVTAELSIAVDELRHWEPGTGWVLEPTTWRIEVGSDHRDLPLSVDVTVE